MVKIAVVGAGIIGLSSAVCIQKSCPLPDTEITVITEKLSPFTTGDGAAGIWLPYLMSNTPKQDIYRWSKATYHLLKEQWKTPDGGKNGIAMIPLVYLSSSSDGSGVTCYKDFVYGFRKMKPVEIMTYRKPSLQIGYSFISFTCEATKFLPHLLQQFQDSGGKLVVKRVENIMELQGDYDIVVNCTGIGARSIVPDPFVRPIRGQVMRVKAPSIKWVTLDEDDDGNYIIPNQDSVVLGGTHQEDDFNTAPAPKDTDFIKSGTARIVPSLKHVPILREWVGLRPARDAVRLEMESIKSSSENGKVPFTIIHNYGHGGSGLTIFWGCAMDAAAMVKDVIQRGNRNDQDHEPFHYVPKSKL